MTAPFPDTDQKTHARVMDLAARVAADASTVAVLLVGSVARGEATRGSDIDLYAVTEGPADAHEEFRFAEGGVMENVHWLPLHTLPSELSDRQALIDWFVHHAAADHLVKNRVLYLDERRSEMLTTLWDLMKIRTDATLHRSLAAAYAAQAVTRGEAATAYANTAPLEAHQTLRRAMQKLLEASLIRLGWTLRGSKRRPEIADAHRNDVLVARTLELLEEVVGLTRLSPVVAQRLARERFAIRRTFVQELRRFAQDAASAAAARREENATDYYSELVVSGYHRGAVNHMRALAGFHRIPRILLQACGSPFVTVDAFLQCSAIGPELRNAWTFIAHLENSDLPGWRARLTALAQELGAEAAR